MTALEAKQKSLWHSLPAHIRQAILWEIEKGNSYVELETKLDDEYIHSLNNLGYHVFLNKECKTHIIHW